MSAKISLGQAISVQPLGDHRYASNFPKQYSNGGAAHGGLIAALFAETARTYFEDQASKRDPQQPSRLHRLHVEYLRPVDADKRGVFLVEDIRRGSLTSLIHIDLYQDNKVRAKAYLTADTMAMDTAFAAHSHTNESQGSIISLSEDVKAIKEQPIPDLVRGLASDPEWIRCRIAQDPYSKVRTNFDFVLRRDSPWECMSVEEWITPRGSSPGADGKEERFSTESLGLVADLWPQIVDSFLRSPYSAPAMVLQALTLERDSEDAVKAGFVLTEEEVSRWVTAWYPTMTLDLQITKPLATDGERWLWQKAWAEQITNKGMDVQLRIADSQGDLVAIGQLVVMVVNQERNRGRTGRM